VNRFTTRREGNAEKRLTGSPPKGKMPGMASQQLLCLAHVQIPRPSRPLGYITSNPISRRYSNVGS